MQGKVDELLVLVFTNVRDKAGSVKGLTELVGNETVLGKAKVDVVEDYESGYNVAD